MALSQLSDIIRCSKVSSTFHSILSPRRSTHYISIAQQSVNIKSTTHYQEAIISLSIMKPFKGVRALLRFRIGCHNLPNAFISPLRLSSPQHDKAQSPL